ncbi:MAG: MMPL family transporter [Actinomycetota bacterium]
MASQIGDVARSVTRSRFYRLGQFAYRRRVWVLIAWLAIFFAASMPLQKLNDRLSQGGFEVPGSQSFQFAQIEKKEFTGRAEFSDLLVMRSKTFLATDPQFRAAWLKIKAAFAKAPGIGPMADPYSAPERFISPDKHVMIAIAGLTDNQSDALKHSPDVEKALTDAAKGTGVEVFLAGDAPFYKAFGDTTVHDLERAEKIALPITLIILVVAFGSIVAAGVPLSLALVSLAISFGIISIVASQTTVSFFAQNIASMVGIGVGIDYSLFILTRFREQLRSDRSVSQSVGEAMSSSGKAVFVSALTVVVALAGTQLVNVAAFKSMGFSAMIAVALAGAAALTLLPAILGMLGKRVNKWAIKRKTAKEGAVWHRWAMIVMRRPWVFLAISLLIVGTLAAPVFGLKMGSSGPGILPEDANPRVAIEIISDSFGAGVGAPMGILVQTPRGVLGGGFNDVYKIAQKLKTYPEILAVNSVATLQPNLPVPAARALANAPEVRPFVGRLVSADGQKSIIEAVTKHGPQSDQADQLVEQLRRDLPALTPAGGRIIVGGQPGLNSDILNEMSNKLIRVVGLVMLLSFLVLLLFFRSILLPLKAILMNTASVLATYGVLVFIFQHGHGESLLGFKSDGIIDAFLPLFLFCILFGLSMDYEVFMLARIREEYLKTHDNTEAVGWGLEHTARIITSAALIMVTVFGAFAFASLVPIKAMGFGLAVAVFLDATIIRVVMVPATMRLMGDWNWWIPAWLDRILPKVTIEESVPDYMPEEEPATV